MRNRKNLFERPLPWRAVAVARVSSEGQENNTSHENQIEAIEAFCARSGLQIVARFEETQSGKSYESRIETQAAIAMIESDAADVLVFYDTTRYGRDGEFQYKILKRLVAAGGQLQLATFRLDYDRETGDLTPESEQMFSILCGMGSVELKYIKRGRERDRVDARRARAVRLAHRHQKRRDTRHLRQIARRVLHPHSGANGGCERNFRARGARRPELERSGARTLQARHSFAARRRNLAPGHDTKFALKSGSHRRARRASHILAAR